MSWSGYETSASDENDKKSVRWCDRLFRTDYPLNGSPAFGEREQRRAVCIGRERESGRTSQARGPATVGSSIVPAQYPV